MAYRSFLTEIQLGEIGSGQELSVHAIHAHSARWDKMIMLGSPLTCYGVFCGKNYT